VVVLQQDQNPEAQLKTALVAVAEEAVVVMVVKVVMVAKVEEVLSS
jgi:hypothetical protein